MKFTIYNSSLQLLRYFQCPWEVQEPIPRWFLLYLLERSAHSVHTHTKAIGQAAHRMNVMANVLGRGMETLAESLRQESYQIPKVNEADQKMQQAKALLENWFLQGSPVGAASRKLLKNSAAVLWGGSAFNICHLRWGAQGPSE